MSMCFCSGEFSVRSTPHRKKYGDQECELQKEKTDTHVAHTRGVPGQNKADKSYGYAATWASIVTRHIWNKDINPLNSCPHTNQIHDLKLEMSFTKYHIVYPLNTVRI